MENKPSSSTPSQGPLRSRALRITVYGLGGLIVALLIFQAGMFVGYRKAEFSSEWGENYFKAFGEETTEAIPGVSAQSFTNSYGAIGTVIKIDLPSIVIAGQDGVEKALLTDDDTAVRKYRNDLTTGDLRLNDFVVVVGDPNSQGQIMARLIRVIPSPPASVSASSTTTVLTH
ncbi:hypothetical protein KGO95_00300 [Patescibacteria group bacterium]|nr:hypothetical protein [Patescibacteria group bacterium]